MTTFETSLKTVQYAEEAAGRAQTILLPKGNRELAMEWLDENNRIRYSSTEAMGRLHRR